MCSPYAFTSSSVSSAFASSGVMTIIQPLSQQSSLTRSGEASRSALIYTTVPATGANRSLSVLTLSIVPKT